MSFSTVAHAALPPIEARSYDLTAVRASTSGRVVLFGGLADGLPVERKILLLRREGRNVMAFRVIKLYPDKAEFAAARLREYEGQKALEFSSNYRALEKIGDLAPRPTVEQQAQDDADLADLESLPPPPAGAPTELDAGLDAEEKRPTTDEFTPPATLDADLDELPEKNGDDAAQNAEAEVSDPEADLIPGSLTVQEQLTFDPDPHAFGAEFLYLRNLRGSYFVAGGVRFSHTFSTALPMGGGPQTSWALDLGAYAYRVSNYGFTVLDPASEAEDNFSLLPVGASVRHTWMVSPDFGAFLYGGLLYTFIVGSFLSTPDDASAVALFNQSSSELGSLGIMAGAGLIYRFGPRWNLRTDLGWDRISMSVMLRF